MDISLQGIVGHLRTTINGLKPEAESGRARSQAELAIVQTLLRQTHKQLSDQKAANASLEKELELITKTLNARLEFYKQLQSINDSVAAYEFKENEDITASAVNFMSLERKLEQKIAASQTKQRYLTHLRNNKGEEETICVICRDRFEDGVLTTCG